MFKLLIITFATFSFVSSAEISLDRIIIPKQLITLDASNANSNAVMVRGDRIHVVGMKDDLMMAYPDAALDYSHANDVMVPGFIEHHIHPLLAAITMNSEILAIDDWIVPNKQSRVL